MADNLRVTAVEPEEPAYAQVIALGDANSSTLGHLPYAVYEEAAESGCLLAAVHGDEVIGYALFALRSRRHEISLTHLCVRDNARGGGSARRLIDEIVRLHPSRRGIRLRCRTDYPAHHMWPKLGFEQWSQRPGRSHAGHPLAVWWRPIADITLFDAPTPSPGPLAVDDRTIAALDTNVVHDLTQERDEDASLALIADWVGDHAEFVITTTVIEELQRGAAPVRPAPKASLSEFRELDLNWAAVDSLHAALRDASGLSAQDDSDLRIVAEAAAGEATYFVSRDESLVRAADVIERVTGITVLRPADFLLSIQDDSDPGFAPHVIKTSGFSIQRSRGIPADDVLARLTDQTRGERAAALRDKLASTIGQPQGCIEEVAASGTLWALAAHHMAGNALRVTVLRSLSDRRAYSLLRQTVHVLRERAVEHDTMRIEITDRLSQTAARALIDEGFSQADDIWWAEPTRQVIGSEDRVRDELSRSHVDGGTLSASEISRIELERWPLKLFTGEVPCLVVPIQPNYGRTLLGYRTDEMQLVETAPEAATARANAYYMARRPGLPAPARVLWWVTGGGPEAGVRAMSWIDSVDTGTPERLHRKYSRRGVFELEQVRDRASPGIGGSPTATVLLFSNTDVFTHPVTAARARELAVEAASRSGSRPDIWDQGFAVTARSISERTAEALYREGMGLAHRTQDV